jgi:hypothetical protein
LKKKKENRRLEKLFAKTSVVVLMIRIDVPLRLVRPSPSIRGAMAACALLLAFALYDKYDPPTGCYIRIDPVPTLPPLEGRRAEIVEELEVLHDAIVSDNKTLRILENSVLAELTPNQLAKRKQRIRTAVEAIATMEAQVGHLRTELVSVEREIASWLRAKFIYDHFGGWMLRFVRTVPPFKRFTCGFYGEHNKH